MLKALSIRQPWAWLIANGFKDVENRSRATTFRGQFLIHASQKFTNREWADAWLMADGTGASFKAVDNGVTSETIERGGIVGIAELYDCVTAEDISSRWFVGPWGWVIRNARPLPFTPCKGMLGFFTPDPSIEIKGL